MKTTIKTLILSAALAAAAGTAQAGPFDAAYQCHFQGGVIQGAGFDTYMVFLSKPDGTAGFAALNIPTGGSGGFTGYVTGQLQGNQFVIPGTASSLAFGTNAQGQMTLQGTFAEWNPAPTLTCTQIF